MRVLLLMRSLDIGGAQRQMVTLAHGLRERGVDVSVLTFYPGGALRAELDAAGVPNCDLGKAGRWDVLPFLWRFARHLHGSRPSVLYSFLPVANLLALLARLFLPGTRVVWGIRASGIDFRCYDRLARLVDGLERSLARYCARVVFNSRAGLAHARQRGMFVGHAEVIGNGIDTGRFRFDPAARARWRASWRIGEDDFVVGVVARIDPMKGHALLLDALASSRGALVVCVGDGEPGLVQALRARACELGVDERVRWLAATPDIAGLYSAFDLVCLPSLSEGFPNVVAEAMSCERVCVVTDVGDAALLVGDSGLVVPAGDAAALAGRIRDVAGMTADRRAGLGRFARQRVEDRFSVAAMVEHSARVLFGGDR
jgi:glycosyltransferase involved in cell wall biosynthesis